jgi:Carboxypeptidase regulatory-like domain/TonB-dependent Receptor Plug Domain/TonB dependent receptor
MVRHSGQKLLAFILVLICCFGFGLRANAQSTTQGAIGGTVFETSGAVVPNATVNIVNDGTGVQVQLKSDNSGYFKAPLLEPGTYTVSINAGGFSPYRANGVIVQVGQLTGLEPHLAVASSTESVEVTEEAPVLNFDSPDFSSTLNKTSLESIPVNNRRWSALAMLTPGVVSDSNGYGLVSVRGISPILNNVLIDGADDNQAYYSEERGRTREAYSTAGSAVREFQMNTGVYSAEYGRAAGGVINSVTKSGTNQIHGEAYFYDRESNWNAYNAYSLITVQDPTTGTYVSKPLKPEDLRKIYGFTVGGPLVKNKLFWMYTFDEHHHIFPGVAVPETPGTFYSLPDAGVAPGTCNTSNGLYTGGGSNATLDSYACTLAARQHLTYAQGSAAYAAAITTLTTDLGTVPRTGDQEINTAKLDYQVTEKEHVSFLYHRLRWASPGGVQTTGTDNYAVDTWGNDYVKLDYGVAKLTSLIATNISNELLYQYGRELNDESQQPFSQYTLNNLVGTGGNVPEVGMDTSIGFYLGSPYYSYRKALPDERKWQIGDTLYYDHGNHSIKFGVDTVHNYDLINNTYESNGDYVYSYISNYVTDLLNKGHASTCNSSALPATTESASGAISSAIGTDPCYSDYYQGFGPPIFAISTFDYGLFVQDNWKFSPRLTLELGLRYDYEFLPSPTPNLTTATGGFAPYPGLTNHPSDKNNFGPRIGFAYDVYGKGKTILRGGYGIYYGRITNGNLLNVLLNTGSPNGQYTTTYKGTTASAPNSFPNPVVTSGGAPAQPNSYFLASNLQNPMVQEFDLMVQQAVGRGTIFQVSYLGALGRELPNFLNLNLNPATVTNYTITVADPTGKGPLPNGRAYIVPTFTGYGNTALFGSVATKFQGITELASNINSNYNAFVAEVQNHSLHSVQFDASYTWSHALDFAQAANTTTIENNWYNPFGDARINYGNSSYNVPNRFVAYALYNFPNTSSSTWYKYLSNNWSINNSFQMQDGLPYTAEASGYAGDAVLNYWNGSSGSELIPGIGVNTEKTPRKIVDDLRVQKEFPIKEGYNLQFMVNVFNLANHQNVDGVTETAYKLTSTGSTTGTATYQGGQSGQATFQEPTSSNNSGFLYTPREIEIAARFSF